MIPPEAIEAAAKGMCGTLPLSQWDYKSQTARDLLLTKAQQVLEAAAPHMQAAWEAERNLEDKADEARREWLDDKDEEL